MEVPALTAVPISDTPATAALPASSTKPMTSSLVPEMPADIALYVAAAIDAAESGILVDASKARSVNC